MFSFACIEIHNTVGVSINHYLQVYHAEWVVDVLQKQLEACCGYGACRRRLSGFVQVCGLRSTCGTPSLAQHHHRQLLEGLLLGDSLHFRPEGVSEKIGEVGNGLLDGGVRQELSFLNLELHVRHVHQGRGHALQVGLGRWGWALRSRLFVASAMEDDRDLRASGE